MARKAADGRCVRPPVVVDDDDQVRWLQVGDLVERLVGHAAGQRTIADHGHHMTWRALAQPCLCDAERVAERGRCVAVFHHIVLGLASRRITGQAVPLAQGRKSRGASGDHLVHIRLVAGVPDDGVLRAVEHPMQGKSELDHAEVGREVPACLCDLLDEERTYLGGKLRELVLVQPLQVGGRVDFGQQAHESLTRGPRGWFQPVRDQLEHVGDPERPAPAPCRSSYVHQAAGVVGSHHRAARLGDRVQLPVRQTAGHRRPLHAERAAEPTAVGDVGDLNHLVARQLQQAPRL